MISTHCDKAGFFPYNLSCSLHSTAVIHRLKIGKRNCELPEINPNSINFIGPYFKENLCSQEKQVGAYCFLRGNLLFMAADSRGSKGGQVVSGTVKSRAIDCLGQSCLAVRSGKKSIFWPSYTLSLQIYVSAHETRCNDSFYGG